MKKQIVLWAGALFLFPSIGLASVCSDGVGIPPFLSSGAKPNLLMVLDNSGSMLDAAYSQTGEILDANGQPLETDLMYQRCIDGDYQVATGKGTFELVTGYDATKTYAGYFEPNAWYKWSGTYPEWESGKLYKTCERVTAHGKIYEVFQPSDQECGVAAGTSNGASIDVDSGVNWADLPMKGLTDSLLVRWGRGKNYPAGSFTWYGPQLYYTENGGVSAGDDLVTDTGITDWKPVDHTWMSDINYDAGDVVSYKGIHYEALSDNPSKSPAEDKGVAWKSLRQGGFVKITAGEAATHCSEKTGTKYNRAGNLCITKNNNNVTAFAARGNMLNWILSSKFDVQKKILTGGKHHYHEGVLVSEHRGCSGSRLIKQIKLDNNGGYLSLGVRGGKIDEANSFLWDRVDTSDDTSRLEILAITEEGYTFSEECQDMMDTIRTKDPSGANWSNPIQACVATFPTYDNAITHQRPMLNHSLQFCSSYWNDRNLRNIKNVHDNCQDLYKGTNKNPPYDPASLLPAYGAYICYGVFDSSLNHTERAGYVGRCWNNAGSGGIAGCDPLQPEQHPESYKYKCTGNSPCYWKLESGNLTSVTANQTPDFKYDNNRVYQCTDNKNPCKSWKDLFDHTNNLVKECTKHSGDSCHSTGWEQLYISGSQIFKGDSTCGDTSGTTGADWEYGDGSNQIPAAVEACIVEASIAYCNDTSVPEVIDPSDQAGDTTQVWNIPGVVADSHIIALMGGSQPLATMKAYIEQSTRPRGVVHNVASDLRLGVMGIHYVGAATECQAEHLNDGIKRFCPTNNKDGAQLFAPLEVGDLVTDENDSTYTGSKRRHMDDVANAINTIRGTSWTPLGEALYSALGYYTQNLGLCLNKDEDGKCLDWCTEKDTEGNCLKYPKDPVQYWCQGNHILLITEGESTADINPYVEKLAKLEYLSDDPDFPSFEEIFPSFEEGDNVDNYLENVLLAPRTCGDSLHSSTYLTAMTWWGQNVLPLYKERYFVDPDGRETPKQNIFTHVVTTGSLMDAGVGECNPKTLMENAAKNGGTDTYYPGENPQQLEDNLYAVLDDILSRSSAGSAASVISSSRSGAGAVYQAVFWPEYKGEEGTKVKWVGDVHSLFVSSEGLMYEDTNQDGKLYPEAKGGADRQIMFYFSSVVNKTRGCYDIQGFWANNFVCPEDPVENCDGTTCVEIQDIKYLWSANRRLAAIDDVMTERTIYTWNDANNDGIVDPGEWFKLTDLYADLNNLTDSKLHELNQIAAAAANARGPVGKDFLTPNDWNVFAEYDASMTAEQREQEALNVLVAWLQGKDDDDGRLRSRRIVRTVDGVSTTTTWRLGDIIHSTPLVVASPAEAYHYIYRDPTYSRFAHRWANRRHMIYFGGNDGMLHAVNGGFYYDRGNQFCCTNELEDGSCKVPPSNGICSDTYDLGEEVWAYIPYNLQPHLKCLADRFYAHKYYVDQKPRIFDVQIFPEDADHVGGWGTILVGSMRFGGAPIKATELNDNLDDERIFTSAFFILDITNPDKPPVLLGEMTLTSEQEGGKDKYTNLNYTTSSPSMIIMRDGEADNAQSEWYLVMGNGPTDQDGTNDQEGTLAILPLEWLKGRLTSWTEAVPKTVSSFDIKPFRIPNKEPEAGGNYSQGGRFLVPLAKENSASFISDIISVDYNIEMKAEDTLGTRYRTDAVYFGTVDGTDFKEYSNTELPDQNYWDGGGRLFRLVTKVLGADGKEIASKPSQWAGRWNDDLPYSQGPIRQLADLKMPVIAAPSIGYDGHNYWVYAGTGRFFGDKDKTDDGWYINDTTNSKVSFFGLKEPIKDANSGFDHWGGGTPPSASSNCKDAVMTWGGIDWDINEKDNSNLDHNGIPGSRGLMQTDNIYVAYARNSIYGNNISYLRCSTGNDKDCFPDPVWEHVIEEHPDRPDNPDSMIEVPVFEKLRQYIAGTGCSSLNDQGISTGLDGWYRDFEDPRERNLGSAALLGGLLTYTSYQPFNDPCSPEGESYLYGVHFQTGTAWTDTVFGTFVYNTQDFVMDRLSLGRGLSTTPSMHVGTGDHAAKAFIQTSTGEIIEIIQENLPLERYKTQRTSWSDRCQ